MFRISAFILFALLLFITFPLRGIEDEGRPFKYVGSKLCKDCHGEDAIGNQYKIWTLSPHAKAYTILLGEKGAEIAKKANITSPEKNVKCLKCHDTGKGLNSTPFKEGVGCEACHGPASEYYTASGHVDYSSRENGYRKALKNGMYPILGIASLKKREKLCLSCHSEERPCYPENKTDNFEFKIPIQTIDSLEKGNVNFRHPLRR